MTRPISRPISRPMSRTRRDPDEGHPQRSNIQGNAVEDAVGTATVEAEAAVGVAQWCVNLFPTAAAAAAKPMAFISSDPAV